MQKLIDTLKSFGIEIPEDKQADVKKALSENYKNAKGSLQKLCQKSRENVMTGKYVLRQQKKP